ncbi:hypothetical protein [Caballeronia sp. LZ032]|uniref:hypothetical protein n=1 Tax=Caballeronia sp. LZ032 TaxID=3038565 RepID=UPI00285A0461|nr:hypothetical protein [Caballeronia sp. LZ032]MDR5879047.1 hypothetical protein [Caballeronia sp. LZ032]
MTKLTYKSAADLIADFKAGAKFEVRGLSTGTKSVTDITAHNYGFGGFAVKHSTYESMDCFRVDGTHPGDSRVFLVKIADAPVTIGKGGVFPLPFKTSQEIVEAFTRGAKFVIELDGKQSRVTSLTKQGEDFNVFNGGTSPFSLFRANGTHPFDYKLIMTAAPSPALAEQLKTKLTAPIEDSVIAPEPFLKRVLAGEHFHVPATREVLHSVEFKTGALFVSLIDEQGNQRTSDNYNHEGKHKWVAGRSLVAGPLPKKPEPERKQVNVDIYRHAFNGSLFVIREGEVVPNIRGISNATKVGSTVIAEPQK